MDESMKLHGKFNSDHHRMTKSVMERKVSIHLYIRSISIFQTLYLSTFYQRSCMESLILMTIG